MALQAGDEAPDFELRSHRGGTVRLSDYRGRKHQMTNYETDKPRIEKADAVVFGLSIDPQPSKAAWAKTLGPISFDLLSDFHPHGEVAQKYGVFRPKEGFSERAIFIVGKDGRIKWSKTYDIPQQPDNAELLAALERL